MSRWWAEGKNPLSVFIQFLILGCIAFGGPIAHLAWFERAFVQRLKWLSHEHFTGLIALCQALPGPASSQAAMGIGFLRCGWSGLWAAWIGFTLPAAGLMLAFALGAPFLPETLRTGLIDGLKVAVVGVIALALWRMSRSLLDSPAGIVATCIFGILFLTIPGPWVVLLILALVTLVSMREQEVAIRPAAMLARVGRRGLILILAVPFLLITLQAVQFLSDSPWSAIGAGFYQTGLMVFGGGHVVLPLLDGLFVDAGWVSNETFLFGYGLAQMVPGPLFSFAAFLGASFPVAEGWRIAAGLLALAALYLPSFLLLGIFLPHWRSGQHSPRWKAILANIHPVVIGLLAATWINPVLTAAITDWRDGAVAVALTGALARFPRLTLPLIAGAGALYAFLPI